ncbi:hypothetical protein [Hoeflea alexandrii]|uniref:Head-to-tail stopper n=1 Tax=Hoeflea alexandrii TaxID=288436 RepID=A0ABT1CV57_9HYPH|nr:hypothetical protein [Hoeflea alexandrii]MCO6410094.1 hypothetical protein [Hoeflea alexandrii]MCY0153066.1 hypothetical protein [Hoeflea alexandrii]
MSNWTDMERRLETDAAALFDTVEVQAFARKGGATVNHRREADPARASFTFPGSLEFNPPPLRNEQFMQAGRSGQSNVAFDAVITVHDDGSWPWLPKRNDHLVADAVIYEIADIHRDGSSRRVFYVNKAKP